MSEPTTEFGFEENDYARPNQHWVCGWAADGNACPLGPTKRGGCRSAFECVPYKDGDSWTCARIQSHGGTCEEGPLPDGTCCQPIPKCTPVRSLMARRALLSFCVFALAIGVALIMISTPARNEIVSPGPLHPQHSTIVQSCADCHEIGEGKLSDWVHTSLDDEAAAKQTELCLKCHIEMKSFVDQPHGVSYLGDMGIRLDKKELKEGNLRKGEPLMVTAAKAIDHHNLACATCHREHHGADHDLTAMTNDQCQVCHQQTFTSFADGHPEFPARRRPTRIYFDHESHYGAHFQKLEGTISCEKCHEPDGTRRNMLVRDFEVSCAECHAKQIEDDLSPGFMVFGIPAVDTETLSPDRIGYFPKIYPNHAGLSTEIHWDQSYAELTDLRDATTDQVKAAEAFIWLLKKYMADVVKNGNSAVHEGNRDIFPVESLRTLVERWFPNLAAEVEAHQNGEPLPANTIANVDINAQVARERQTDRTVTSGWYVRDADLSIRYRPSGHADPVMRRLMDFEISTVDDLQQASPLAAGRCLKCHSVKREYDRHQAKHILKIRWDTKQPTPNKRPFTSFNHGPHLTLMSNDACEKCHKVKSNTPRESLLREEYFSKDLKINTDSTVYVHGNFEPLTKSNCTQCHTPSGAGDSCLSCHNYHVR